MDFGARTKLFCSEIRASCSVKWPHLSPLGTKEGGQDGEEGNGGRERGEDGQTKCVEEEMRDEQMEGGAARVC